MAKRRVGNELNNLIDWIIGNQVLIKFDIQSKSIKNKIISVTRSCAPFPNVCRSVCTTNGRYVVDKKCARIQSTRAFIERFSR